MILGAFLRALAQFGADARFRGVLWRGLGLSVALLAGFSWALIAGVGWLAPDSVTLPWLGEVGWLDEALGWSLIPAMLLLSVVLMVPVASAITGIFLDTVAEAVETRHYPGLPPARRQPFPEMVADTLGFLGLLLGANLAALVLYLMFAPLAPLIFWAVNGFLLGREYFTLAAARRLGREEARRLRRRHAATIWAAGTLMALPLSLPLVNLLIPILGAATFTHLFHALRARDPSG
ncbi:EI24 domain-containing protein [Roseivivax sp. CAU 1761]